MVDLERVVVEVGRFFTVYLRSSGCSAWILAAIVNVLIDAPSFATV